MLNAFHWVHFSSKPSINMQQDSLWWFSPSWLMAMDFIKFCAGLVRPKDWKWLPSKEDHICKFLVGGLKRLASSESRLRNRLNWNGVTALNRRWCSATKAAFVRSNFVDPKKIQKIVFIKAKRKLSAGLVREKSFKRFGVQRAAQICQIWSDTV